MAFFQRQRNFWNEVIWKPKKHLSLDQLKYHYYVIERNPTVTESNKKLLVETFRSIAEILIWGDQNDSSVFDFFLEKNMQSYFLQILNQNCGRYMTLQLLQTLSILFENIRNETSIYYLLSNNHVNSIIVLKLDFSDEEVLAYYISFLKTLSFKLNNHTIHFFYNEHLRDFPLYTEAIKFFNHPESMVRIAVRTLTLNVYKVNDKNMLKYVCNKTAAPYFSNLVWFIGNHVLELDDCLPQANHLKRSHLESLVAEHLDHLHYLHDILSLNVSSLNEILIDHLLNRLLIPLYVNSMSEISVCQDEETPHINSKIALFLLSQVFLILSTSLLMNQLAFLILTGDQSLTLFPSLPSLEEGGGGGDKTDKNTPSPVKHRRNSSRGSIRGFIPPEESLSSLNRSDRGAHPVKVQTGFEGVVPENRWGHTDPIEMTKDEGSSTESQSHMKELSSIPEYDGFVVIESPSEREKLMMATRHQRNLERQRRKAAEEDEEEEEDLSPINKTPVHSIPIISTLFIDSLLSSMIPQHHDDSSCLFSISLVYGLMSNEGVDSRLLEAFSLTKDTQNDQFYLHNELVVRLLSVLEASAVGSVRLVTLHMCLTVLRSLLIIPSTLTDHQNKKLERAIEESCVQLARFYKNLGPGDDMFLEMFEDEYSHEMRFRLQVNHLLMDDTLLLPPTETPMTGIDFTRRLPCGDTEKARRAMRVFFALREFRLQLDGEEETLLPLTPRIASVTTEDVVDTNSCDLVSCKVVTGESTVERFMLVTDTEFMLVNPHKTQVGCGVVKFIAFLQDVDISTDPADYCALYIIAHHRSKHQVKRRPALSARFTFEDHIRCLATRQSLQRRKETLRHSKMVIIASLLGLPPPASPLRKRQDSPPSTLPVPNESTDGPSPVSSLSPRNIHSLANQTFNSSSDHTPLIDQYELDTLDSNGVPSEMVKRSPSPHAHYIHNTGKVTLSFGGQESRDTDLPLVASVALDNVGSSISNEVIEDNEGIENSVTERGNMTEQDLPLCEKLSEKEESINEEESSSKTAIPPLQVDTTVSLDHSSSNKEETVSDTQGLVTDLTQILETV